MKLGYQLILGAALALSVGCSSTLVQPCTVGRAEGGSYLATAVRTSSDLCDDNNGDGVNDTGGDGYGDDTYAAAAKGWNIDYNHFTFRVEKFSTEADGPNSFGKHVAIVPRWFLHGSSGTHKNEPLSDAAVAVGDLTSDFSVKDPDANNLATCKVPSLTAAHADAFGIGVEENLAFSNVKFLTEPGFQGAEVGFDLEYTDLAGCVSTYKVVALQPATPCAVDADCHWDVIATDPTCNTVTGMLNNIPAHCDALGAAGPGVGYCAVSGDFPVTGPGYSCAAQGFAN